MPSRSLAVQIPVTIGLLEGCLDFPESLFKDSNFLVRGLALVAHPHPLMGGTMDNKVTQTMAKALNQLGYITLRTNFRGVGSSAGSFDDGVGETNDLYEVLDWLQCESSWSGLSGLETTSWLGQLSHLPVVLGGFSFGSYVVSRLMQRFQEENKAIERLILIGTAASKWDVPQVPKNSLIIHGELDETILLSNVLGWARDQELSVTVIPGADHFFHRKLHCIRDIILRAWLGQAYDS